MDQGLGDQKSQTAASTQERAFSKLANALTTLEPVLVQVLSEYAQQSGRIVVDAQCLLASRGLCSLACDALAYGLLRHGFRVDLLGKRGLDASQFGSSDHEVLLVQTEDCEPFVVDPTYLQFFRCCAEDIAGKSPIVIFGFGNAERASEQFAGANYSLRQMLACVWGARGEHVSYVDSHENYVLRRHLWGGPKQAEVAKAMLEDQLRFHQLLEKVGWLGGPQSA
ncbi:MAG: hypothetical protein K1X79_02825 [Oligoflexia bacterium]|nr:hypothetical protein [Oligoflexia bacterium]